MATNARTRSKSRRSRKAPDRAAERRARDAELIAERDEALDDPELMQRLLSLSMSTSALSRFSLPNQVFLLKQAEERGIDLSGGVYTYEDWGLRGRQVERGQSGLWVIVPAGRVGGGKKSDEDPAEAQPAAKAATEAEEGEEGKEEGAVPRMRFRADKRFAFPQTKAVEFDDDDEPLSPEAELARSLTRDLERAGYTVKVDPWPDGSRVDVDHEERTVVYTGPSEQTLGLLMKETAAIYKQMAQA